MQTQKKFQVESEKYEFLIKFEQEKISDLGADFKMCEDDELEEKKKLKLEIKKYQSEVEALEEVRNLEEKRRYVVLVDWNNILENNNVSGLTSLETPPTTSKASSSKSITSKKGGYWCSYCICCY